MKQVVTFILGVVLSACAAYDVQAGSQCYATPEVEAEQLLRLHSQLMVVAITCHTTSDGQNLVPAYTGFTKNHIQALHEAEQVMKRYYKQVYGGDGVAQLDKLRTRLGNEYGQKIADLSAPIFCQQYRDEAMRLCHASSGEIQDEVARRMDSNKTYVQACTAPAPAAAHLATRGR